MAFARSNPKSILLSVAQLVIAGAALFELAFDVGPTWVEALVFAALLALTVFRLLRRRNRAKGS